MKQIVICQDFLKNIDRVGHQLNL